MDPDSSVTAESAAETGPRQVSNGFISLRLTLRPDPINDQESVDSGSPTTNSRPRERPKKESSPSQRKPRTSRHTATRFARHRRPPKSPRPIMAHGAEDCATVLEQFVHDVANLPLEINHLMEEIQAKDKTMQECRTTINSRDGSIQKFIKMNGSLAPNPKEEQYSKTILQNLDQCQQLQDEKIQLSEKACVLLDRQIKRLDVRIRDLVNEGLLSNDPPLPSLFDNHNKYRDPPKVFFPDSTPADSPSYATPLNPPSGTSNLVLAAAQRLSQAVPRAPGPISLATQTGARSSAPATPAGAAAVQFQQRQRESSAGAVDSKRRRLNTSLGTLPAASSNLRQSSLGPGTPKAGTPAGSRAGSAGPRASTGIKKALTKKVAPHQQVKKIKTAASHNKHNKRSSSASGRVKSSKKSPTGEGEEDDDSMLSSADMSDSDKSDDAGGDEDVDEEDDEDEGAEDTRVYCTCRTVSHGDMVACDNDSCPYEWFHWKCVGLTREPVGTWYCDECRKTLGK
ncbi:Zinc finger PHD-type [Penicillium macrosclerotiorum]|uniref:Zinc finger PHD-type n=1 Tax=Penicillium macrosclerotiorum TaxID=303699 RepID=UPI0025486BAA|nr:Zinc finger PHD-type [Penicillium macrosclerotiorum]KAJ5698152.1 Zinc finger PHD-type [Penicillium macrosclerotiorum]